MNDLQTVQTPTRRNDNVQSVVAVIAVAALLMGGAVVKTRTGLYEPQMVENTISE